jgi:transposase
MMMKIHQSLFKQIHLLSQQMIIINKRVTQATMTHLTKMIKWHLWQRLLHKVKNRFINQELIIKSPKIIPLTKSWVTLVRVFKLDLVLLLFVNIILLYLLMSLSV